MHPVWWDHQWAAKTHSHTHLALWMCLQWSLVIGFRTLYCWREAVMHIYQTSLPLHLFSGRNVLWTFLMYLYGLFKLKKIWKAAAVIASSLSISLAAESPAFQHVFPTVLQWLRVFQLMQWCNWLGGPSLQSGTLQDVFTFTQQMWPTSECGSSDHSTSSRCIWPCSHLYLELSTYQSITQHACEWGLDCAHLFFVYFPISVSSYPSVCLCPY